MISLIISVYKHLDYLSLIFQGIENQSYRDFEVIVAEDNDDMATANFIAEACNKYSFLIRHVSQKDDGFRKCAALNKAVVLSKGEKLVLIDGDCIPHRHFLKEYDKHIKTGLICFGRRAMIGKKQTEKLIMQNSIETLNFLSMLYLGGHRLKHAVYLPFINDIKKTRGIWGCNWGILKEHILQINGFDEDYTKAGAGEDSDVEWRLKLIGLEMFSMSYKAIVYHLEHPLNYTDTNEMEVLIKKKIKENKTFCSNGITKM